MAIIFYFIILNTWRITMERKGLIPAFPRFYSVCINAVQRCKRKEKRKKKRDRCTHPTLDDDVASLVTTG